MRDGGLVNGLNVEVPVDKDQLLAPVQNAGRADAAGNGELAGLGPADKLPVKEGPLLDPDSPGRKDPAIL